MDIHRTSDVFPNKVLQPTQFASDLNIYTKTKSHKWKTVADVKEPINVKESHRSFTSKLTCDVLETFGDYGSKQKSVKVTDEDKNAYTVSQILGKGGFAKVYRLHDRDDDLMAIKIIAKRTLTKPEKRDKVAREIDIHRRLQHRNVVEFIKHFQDEKFVYLVMEFCGTMTLSSILKTRQTITECEVRYYLQQILAGCKHIHSHGIVHRDLKLSNLLINDHMVLKIADFGLSTILKGHYDKKESICGTPNYISPEVIQKSGHSYPADVWAVGCIVHALMSGRPPFETQTLKDTYKMISKGKYTEPSHASVNARHFVKSCLQVQPTHRPDMAELEKSGFLTDGFIPPSLPLSAANSTPQFADGQGRKEQLDGRGNKIISAVEYFIETIEDQVICAEGGKDPSLVDQSVVLENKQLLVAIQTCFQKIKDKFPKSNPPQSHKTKNCLWITKWVDYSHKYGFGFQLSNKIYGASLTDGCSIAVSTDKGHVGLQHSTHKELVECRTSDLPDAYQRILKMMNYFVKYMDEALIIGGQIADNTKEVSRKPLVTEKNGLSSIYILHWLRTKECIVICLSTGTVQANFFNDHTKLVVSRVGAEDYKLMYINTKRSISVFDLSEIAQSGLTEEIKVRFHYLMLQLSIILDRYT